MTGEETMTIKPSNIHEQLRPLLQADEPDLLKIGDVLAGWRAFAEVHELDDHPAWVEALRAAREYVSAELGRRGKMGEVVEVLARQRAQMQSLSSRLGQLEEEARRRSDALRGDWRTPLERAGGVAVASETMRGDAAAGRWIANGEPTAREFQEMMAHGGDAVDALAYALAAIRARDGRG